MTLRTAATLALVGSTIAAIVAGIALTQYSTSGPSPFIEHIPLKINSSSINQPPGGIPADVRCDWFVLCGKYTILGDYRNSSSVIGKIGNNITLLGVDFRKGDYIELAEFGVARQSGDRAKYRDPGKGGYLNNVCYPRTGKWHAERIRIDNDPKHYVHRVTLDLFAYLCNTNFHLGCTVEMFPKDSNRQEKSQLLCDDGSIWVLSN